MTTTHHSQTTAAEKFAAMLATAQPDHASGQPYRSDNGLFVLTTSPRIAREPVAVVWGYHMPQGPFFTPEGVVMGGDNHGRRLGPANVPDAGGRSQSVQTLEDGLVFMARRALGVSFDREGHWHELAAVVWDDGSWSWASFRWSLFGGEGELGTVYINSAAGSPMVTARFDKETLRNPVR